MANGQGTHSGSGRPLTEDEQKLIDTFIGASSGGTLGPRTASPLVDEGTDVSKITPKEYGDLLVYHAGHGYFRDPVTGDYTNTRRYEIEKQARDSAIIAESIPELANTPAVLDLLAREPGAARRIRQMSNARQWAVGRVQALMMNAQPTKVQQHNWELMSSVERAMLRQHNYRPPSERPAGEAIVQVAGLNPFDVVRETIDFADTVTFGGVKAAGRGIVKTGSDALEAFLWAENEVKRVYRAFEYVGREEDTNFPWLANPAGIYDAWTRAKDGERFFVPGTQEQALAKLDGDEAALELAIDLAAGEDLITLTQEYSGLSGPTDDAYGETYQQLQAFRSDPVVQDVVNLLRGSTISPGRTFANAAGLQPGEMGYDIASGIVDGAFTIFTDPTLIAGKTAKATIYTRRGLANGSKAFQRLSANLPAKTEAALTSAGWHGDVNRGMRYWTELSKLPISREERIMVALADHAVNGRMVKFQREVPQASRFVQALPQVDVPLPGGAVERTTRTFKNRQEVFDWVLDERLGMSELYRGSFQGNLSHRMLVPRLTRTGVARIRAKVGFQRFTDWSEDTFLALTRPLDPDDVDNSHQLVAEYFRRHIDTTDNLTAESLSGLREYLRLKGVDPDLVADDVARIISDMTGVAVRNHGDVLDALVWHQVLTGNIDQVDDALGAIARYDDELADLYRRGVSIYDQAVADGSVLLDMDVLTRAPQLLDITRDVRTRLRPHYLRMAEGGDEAFFLDETGRKILENLEDALSRMGVSQQRTEELVKLTDEAALRDVRFGQGRNLPADPLEFDNLKFLDRIVKLPIAYAGHAMTRFTRMIPYDNVLTFGSRDELLRARQFLAYRLPGPKADELLERLLTAPTEAAKRAVFKEMVSTVFARTGLWDDPDWVHFVNFWVNHADQGYGRGDIMETADGLHRAATLYGAQRAGSVRLPPLREIEAAARKARFVKFASGHGAVVGNWLNHMQAALSRGGDALETFMRWWRVMVVLRPALVTRGGGEELFNQGVRFGGRHVLETHALRRLSPYERSLSFRQIDMGRAQLHDIIARGDELPTRFTRYADGTEISKWRRPWLIARDATGRLLKSAGVKADDELLFAAAMLTSDHRTMRLAAPVMDDGAVMGARVEAGYTDQLKGDIWELYTGRRLETGEWERIGWSPKQGEWVDYTRGDPVFKGMVYNRWRQIASDQGGRRAARAQQLAVPRRNQALFLDDVESVLDELVEMKSVVPAGQATTFESVTYEALRETLRADPRRFIAETRITLMAAPPHVRRSILTDEPEEMFEVLRGWAADLDPDDARPALSRLFDADEAELGALSMNHLAEIIPRLDEQSRAILTADPRAILNRIDHGGVNVDLLPDLESGRVFFMGRPNELGLTEEAFAANDPGKLAAATRQGGWSGPVFYLTNDPLYAAHYARGFDHSVASIAPDVMRVEFQPNRKPRLLDLERLGPQSPEAETISEAFAAMVQGLTGRAPRGGTDDFLEALADVEVERVLIDYARYHAETLDEPLSRGLIGWLEQNDEAWRLLEDRLGTGASSYLEDQFDIALRRWDRSQDETGLLLYNEWRKTVEHDLGVANIDLDRLLTDHRGNGPGWASFFDQLPPANRWDLPVGATPQEQKEFMLKVWTEEAVPILDRRWDGVLDWLPHEPHKPMGVFKLDNWRVTAHHDPVTEAVRATKGPDGPILPREFMDAVGGDPDAVAALLPGAVRDEFLTPSYWPDVQAADRFGPLAGHDMPPAQGHVAVYLPDLRDPGTFLGGGVPSAAEARFTTDPDLRALAHEPIERMGAPFQRELQELYAERPELLMAFGHTDPEIARNIMRQIAPHLDEDQLRLLRVDVPMTEIDQYRLGSRVTAEVAPRRQAIEQQQLNEVSPFAGSPVETVQDPAVVAAAGGAEPGIDPMTQAQATIARELYRSDPESYRAALQVPPRVYRAAHPELVDGLTTEQTLERMAEATNLTVLELAYVDGEIDHKLLAKVAQGRIDLDDFMLDNVRLPETIRGPLLEAPESSDNIIVSGIKAGTDVGMRGIQKAIEIMARHPLWLREYATAATEMKRGWLPLRRNQALFDRAAKIVGDQTVLDDLADELFVMSAVRPDGAQEFDLFTDLHPKDMQDALRLSDVEVNIREAGEVLRWWNNERYLRQELHTMAASRATERTIPFIDDYRLRTQFSELARNYFPFWFAEEQFYRRWARTLVASPESLRRGQLAINGLRASGFIREDPERGDLYFVYPGSQFLVGMLTELADALPFVSGEWAQVIAAPMTGQLRYSAPGFDELGMPQGSPLVSLPLRGLRQIMPELVTTLERDLLGERGVGRSAPEQVMPSFFYRGFKAFTVTEEELHSDVIGAMQLLYAVDPDAFPDETATAHERSVFMDRLRNHARIRGITRWLMGTTVPASPQDEFDPMGLAPEYREAFQAEVPIEEGLAQFLEANPNGLPYTVWATDNPSRSPAQPVESTLEYLKDHDEFYDRHHAAGPWLLPAPEDDDEFSPDAWQEFLAQEMRIRNSDDEWYDELMFARSARTWFEAVRERDHLLANTEDSTARRAIRMTFSQWANEEFLPNHPIFEEELRTGERQQQREQVLDEMRIALEAPDRPEVAHAGKIEALIKAYDDFKARMTGLRYKPNTEEVQATRDALRIILWDWGTSYTEGDVMAQGFWQRIIVPLLELPNVLEVQLEEAEED